MEKQKRIKRVFGSSDQVMHLWANQSQDSARCDNVFFEGNKIYSYGYHYELGRIVTYNDKTVALINERGYSVATSKHIRHAKSAASHLIVIGYTNFDEDIETMVRQALLEDQGALVDELMGHFSRNKFYSWSGDKLQYAGNYLSERVQEFNQKCHALNHSKYALNPDQTYIELYNEHIERRLARQKELESPEAELKREKARQAKEARELLKQSDTIERWRRGEYNGSLNIQTPLLRIVQDEVQTSRGASVSLKSALRLYSRIKADKTLKDQQIDHFKFNRYNPSNDTIVIGCHTIQWSEVEQVLGGVK
jgi:hypothetical protein